MPPKLNEDVIKKMIKNNLEKYSQIHIFFTGVKIRILRGNNHAAIDYADKRDEPLGVYNKNACPPQLIEKQILQDANEALQQMYG